MRYLTDNNLWDPRQHGSRGGHSTLSQLITHYDYLLEGLEEKRNVDVVYLDYKKAFNKADHGVILTRLKEKGIGGKLGLWIKSFLEN